MGGGTCSVNLVGSLVGWLAKGRKMKSSKQVETQMIRFLFFKAYSPPRFASLLYGWRTGDVKKGNGWEGVRITCGGGAIGREQIKEDGSKEMRVNANNGLCEQEECWREQINRT